MGSGRVLADAVRSWVGAQLPGELVVADSAARVAEAAYDDGATIRDACDEAACFVGSWLRHPSHWRAGQDVVVAQAS